MTLLTDAATAAPIVGWSERALIRAARAGEVPCVRRGRRYYFSLTALRRHFEGEYDDVNARSRFGESLSATSGPGTGPLGSGGHAPRRTPRQPHRQDPRGSQGRARRAPATPRRQSPDHPEYPPFGLPRAVGE